MKRNRISKGIILVIAIVVAVNICLMVFTGNKKDIGAVKTFDCDVKILRLNTDIHVSSDGEQLYNISGNILRILTDPLTLYDTSGNKLAYAGDQYHIITQDTHWIITDSEAIEMVGNFNFFGDSYDLFIDGEKVAHAKFDFLNTYGTIVDNDGNLMADYTSRLYFKDYAVQATKYNIFSDEALNLIFASYYSDQEADSRSSSSSHSNNNN